MTPMKPQQLLPHLAISQGATLEQRLAKLEQIIKVEDDGTVTIQSDKIKIKGATSVEIECSQNVTIKGGVNMKFDAGGNLSLRGCSNVEIQASGPLSLRAGAETNVQGSVVKLNGGTKPVARLGETVVNGTIQGGCSTVFG